MSADDDPRRLWAAPAVALAALVVNIVAQLADHPTAAMLAGIVGLTLVVVACAEYPSPPRRRRARPPAFADDLEPIDYAILAEIEVSTLDQLDVADDKRCNHPCGGLGPCRRRAGHWPPTYHVTRIPSNPESRINP